MARLYLIRHARPSSTWGGHDDDPGLDALGREQAEAARDWLLALPVGERPSRVASSPLRRCRETAQPTALALGVEIDIDPIVGEIPTPAALAAEERPAWLRTAFGGRWSEIEGDLDYDAWRDAIVARLRTYGDTAVFSHYVAINAAVSRLTGDDRVLSFRPDHASITVLETDGADLRLVARGAEAQTSVL
jgi:broad specificity phosphatase PhoE